MHNHGHEPHGHDRRHSHAHGLRREGNKRSLTIALVITSPSQVLARAVPLLEQRFGIRHTTIQAVDEGTDMGCWGCRGGTCTFAAVQ